MKRAPSLSPDVSPNLRGHSPSSRRKIDNATEFETQSHSLFFKLPRELRDAIYALLLDDVQYHFVDEGLSFVLRLGDKADTTSWSSPPSWSLANKQILSEVLEYVYREAVCTEIARYAERFQNRQGALRGRCLRRFEVEFMLRVDLSEGVGGFGVAEKSMFYIINLMYYGQV